MITTISYCTYCIIHKDKNRCNENKTQQTNLSLMQMFPAVLLTSSHANKKSIQKNLPPFSEKKQKNLEPSLEAV